MFSLVRSIRAVIVVAFFLSLCAVRPGNEAQDASYDPHKFMLAKSHYEKGMKLLGSEREGEAVAELLEAVKVFPEYADAYIQLGNLSMRKKDFTQGLERYLQAQTALANLQGISRRQQVERRRQLQESIDLVQERIESLRHSQRASDIGKVDREMLRLEKLKQENTKTMPESANPCPPELYFLIGNARLNLERFDEAIKDFQQALVLKPEYGEAHNNLAVIYLYRKDYAQAWEHVHAAEKAGVRINPQFREELAALASEPSLSAGH